MEIHQVLPTAAYGDAITGEAVALRALLRRHGRSEIYARFIDGRVPEIRELGSFPEPAARRLILFHASIGDPVVFDFLAGRTEPLILRYHNITEPAFFEPYDPALAGLLRSGREQVAGLLPRVTRAIAVSAFNASDLAGMGYAGTSVVPLLLDIEHLAAVRPRAPRFSLPGPGAGAVILSVGRLAPNKRPDLLLQAFHVLKTYHRQDAVLVLAGSNRHTGYEIALQRLAFELALTDVVFAGHVTDAELAFLYRRADLLSSLSQHEGFGAPPLEAMRFETPVLAARTSAVGETVGDAGLLLDDVSPTVAAEAMLRLLDDAALRQDLVERGRRHLRAFEPGTVGPRLLREVLSAA